MKRGEIKDSEIARRAVKTAKKSGQLVVVERKKVERKNGSGITLKNRNQKLNMRSYWA